MRDQGILVVVSGFSGAGKGTLMRALLKKYHNCLSDYQTAQRGRNRRKGLFLCQPG